MQKKQVNENADLLRQALGDLAKEARSKDEEVSKLQVKVQSSELNEFEFHAFKKKSKHVEEILNLKISVKSCQTGKQLMSPIVLIVHCPPTPLSNPSYVKKHHQSTSYQDHFQV